MRRGGRLLLATLLLAAPARAEERSVEASRQAAREGIAAYTRGDYDRALRLLNQATQGMEFLEVPEQVTLHKYLAYTQVAFDRSDAAEEEFKKALALDPGLTLPDGLSPKILAVFRKTRSDMEKAQATPTPFATPTPSPTPAGPSSTAPQTASVGLALGGTLPVHSFHGAKSLYGADLLSVWENGATGIGLGLGYRANSNDPQVTVQQWHLDIGVSRYLTGRSEWAPYADAGISLSTVLTSLPGQPGTQQVAGLGGWVGGGVAMARGQGVRLIGFARYRVDFPGGGDINQGPILGVILAISRRPSSCCF